MATNYIFVTGGVVSGVGKGVITASIGRVLMSKGFRVTAIKIDPYINLDAGTLRPTEHGEVWVTEDGGEIDQDLGHYERFLDTTLSREHNMTTGQVYKNVIEKERRGEFLGKTVQIIPHISNEVKGRIRKIAGDTKSDFVIVEVGGVVGDYENILFLEAAREMKFDGDKVVYVHVGYLPVLPHLGEMKSKPLQHSVRSLLEVGIVADFIVCRSPQKIDSSRIEKIAMFCNVKRDDIIPVPDVSTIYDVPISLEDQGFADKILAKFGVEAKKKDLSDWRAFVDVLKNSPKEVKVGIVGKYFDTGDFELSDSYVSVIESIKHAAVANGAKPIVSWVDSKKLETEGADLSILKSFDGIIVPGGFGKGGTEGKIMAIKYARENDIPFLGLCYGLQLAVVEYARSFCGMDGANTTEVDEKTKYPVVDLLPWQKEIIKNSGMGNTMRLGAQEIKIVPGTLASKLYGSDKVVERFRHRYEINPNYVDEIKKKGFVFSGISEKENIMQIGELPNHKFFIGIQAHPEFTSRPLKPNPLFNGFIRACLEK